jgi:hypothetical protein
MNSTTTSKVFFIPFAESFIFPYGNIVLMPRDFIPSIETFTDKLKKERSSCPAGPIYCGRSVKITFKQKENRVFEESERLYDICSESEQLIWYFGKGKFLKNLQNVFQKNQQQFDTLFLDPIGLKFSDKVENCLFVTTEFEEGRVGWDLLPLRSPITATLLVCLH